MQKKVRECQDWEVLVRSKRRVSTANSGQNGQSSNKMLWGYHLVVNVGNLLCEQ